MNVANSLGGYVSVAMLLTDLEGYGPVFSAQLMAKFSPLQLEGV